MNEVNDIGFYELRVEWAKEKDISEGIENTLGLTFCLMGSLSRQVFWDGKIRRGKKGGAEGI